MAGTSSSMSNMLEEIKQRALEVRLSKIDENNGDIMETNHLADTIKSDDNQLAEHAGEDSFVSEATQKALFKEFDAEAAKRARKSRFEALMRRRKSLGISEEKKLQELQEIRRQKEKYTNELFQMYMS